MTSGKVTLALLRVPALFHYGETLVTTTYIWWSCLEEQVNVRNSFADCLLLVFSLFFFSFFSAF